MNMRRLSSHRLVAEGSGLVRHHPVNQVKMTPLHNATFHARHYRAALVGIAAGVILNKVLTVFCFGHKEILLIRTFVKMLSQYLYQCQSRYILP